MNLINFEKNNIKKSEIMQEVQKACREILINNSIAENARTYLNKRISENNQEIFQVGYFPENEHLDILLKSVSEKKLKYVKLIYNNYLQHNEQKVISLEGNLSKHNIIFPFRDLYGNIKSFVGRSYLDDQILKKENISKYKYSNFKKSFHLFGLYNAKEEILKKNYVIIVEGQIDCISCYQFGIQNVVSLSGSNLNHYQLNLIMRYTNNIYLLLDNDLAGEKAKNKIKKKYKDLVNIDFIRLPDNYKDIDQYLNDGKNFNDLQG